MNKIDKVIHGMQTSDLPSDYWITSNIEFPELEDSRSIMQRNGQSVCEHTMLVIDLIEPKNPITLLSGLFHDLGKYYAQSTDDNSTTRFPNHAIVSAGIAKTKLTEWQASPDLIDRVIRLITTHMYDTSNAAKERTIRKFIAEVGSTNIDNWFALRIADSRSYTAYQQHYSRFIKPFRKAVMLYLEQQPSFGQPELKCQGDVGSVRIKGGDDT